MRIGARWPRLAAAVALGAGVALVGGPARSERTATTAEAADRCEPGQVREGKLCMSRIAPAGACAGARDGGSAGGCSGAIGLARDRFSPVSVAAEGPGGFDPGPPGPDPGPRRQPGDITNGGNGPQPPPQPAIVVIESPARPDRPPGLEPQ